MKKNIPNTREGWHEFYIERFNATGSDISAHMAMWYQLLYLAFDS